MFSKKKLETQEGFQAMGGIGVKPQHRISFNFNILNQVLKSCGVVMTLTNSNKATKTEMWAVVGL